ncbi:MAG: FAD-binding oxidoreductase [Spirochaetota bacterium]
MSGFTFLGKQLRGRFGLPSGVVATNPDIARWMLTHIDSLGFYVGKSTTIEGTSGYPEDILVQPTADSLWNAVGYANPGLEETVAGFESLGAVVPGGVFLMPQIGESTAERFVRCVTAFDGLGPSVDGIELNLSCPHADKAGILIGSDVDSVREIVGACREATEKPLVVKVNAGVPDVIAVSLAAVDAGADALSLVNTLGGPNPELSHGYGGLSGRPLFPVLIDTLTRLRRESDVPVIAMGGVGSASDVRRIDEIAPDALIAVGSVLAELDSAGIVEYFRRLESDLETGGDEAYRLVMRKETLEYRPFIVRSKKKLAADLAVVTFRESMPARAGQFVFVKTAADQSKPYSVASNENGGLELLVRGVGPASRALTERGPGAVLRIRGPYGRAFSFPREAPVVFVGAGCGIAPILRAAQSHVGPKRFALGTRSVAETAFLDRLEALGPVVLATEDGSSGFRGVAVDALERLLSEEPADAETIFYNCGPEIVLAQVDTVEREIVVPERIYHVVERMTACGIGICGKCATPEGLRICVDGPVFSAQQFTPMRYSRDKTGAVVDLGGGPKSCPPPRGGDE